MCDRKLKFGVDDLVRVKHGVADVDYPDSPNRQIMDDYTTWFANSPLDDVDDESENRDEEGEGPWDDGDENWGEDGNEDDFEELGEDGLTEETGPFLAPSKTGRNDPCPCGSGKKFKKCCLGKEQFGQPEETRPKFPIGTIALYGPDDRRTTKIVAAVIRWEGAEPMLQRWVGSNVTENPKVRREIQDFFKLHGVKSVVATDRNMGCPHEEGEDFPEGGDCPFCPFWKGKQGSGAKE